jgi:hypothetical protein
MNSVVSNEKKIVQFAKCFDIPLTKLGGPTQGCSVRITG